MAGISYLLKTLCWQLPHQNNCKSCRSLCRTPARNEYNKDRWESSDQEMQKESGREYRGSVKCDHLQVFGSHSESRAPAVRLRNGIRLSLRIMQTGLQAPTWSTLRRKGLKMLEWQVARQSSSCETWTDDRRCVASNELGQGATRICCRMVETVFSRYGHNL